MEKNDRKETKGMDRQPARSGGMDRRAFLLRGSAAVAGAAVAGPALAAGETPEEARQRALERAAADAKTKKKQYDPDDLQAGWFTV